MGVKYQCCFCGKAIESRLPDVGGLLYTTAIDRDLQFQHGQQFYCHTSCLSERLHVSAKLYVVDLLEIDESVTSGEPR
jgi:hypothetical protein